MKITINADTIFWTDIRVESVNGDPLFNGHLKLEADWYTLYDTRKDCMGDVVGKWAGRREHLPVLADALKAIHKQIVKGSK